MKTTNDHNESNNEMNSTDSHYRIVDETGNYEKQNENFANYTLTYFKICKSKK